MKKQWQSKSKLAAAVLCCMALTVSACSEGDSLPVSTTSTATATPKTTAESVSATADTQTNKPGYVNEMDKTNIMTISINVDEAQWQEMLDNASEEEYISTDITINGTTIKNVGIRPKGNSSLRKVLDNDTTDRFSFKIKFDKYVEDQTWLGLDKIVINNMDADKSYLKEYISYDIMSTIGVDAPLYAFADIQVNGKAWGFYLAVEVLDSAYLDRTKEGEGELYKPNNDGDMGQMGGFGGRAPENGEASGNLQQPSDMQFPEGMRPPSDMQLPEGMQPPSDMQFPNGDMGGRGFPGGMNGAQNGVSLAYSDDAISSYSAIFDNADTKTTEEDHQRIITALKHLNDGTDLDTYVDVDAVLKYFAAHTVVVNMDSYTSTMGHNYYLYEHDGQISILPWDYNLAFGGFQGGTAGDVVNLAIDTPVSGVSLEDRPLLGKLLEVPEYKEKYHAYLQQIMDGYFANGKFEQTVASLDQLISDYVKNDPSSFTTFEAYKQAVVELTKLGTLRAESIQGQLNGEIPSTTEDQKADSGKLVDASSVDLSKLGDMGRGMPGGNRFGGGMRMGESPNTSG
ncbi:CotH kinase family protein [Paenibacillus sp. J5C_2022]|uniref:CotH kinase family protein n=1 Tax=Paenibacillus sp. J5C2022 TaxID=2977129 RepID=UPI0021D1BB09|nr:CotH kinase family protein [Paenibacillus sp. J5C2022]MCU6710479.1 CotH kinase family protein [Paenibacillus sp. J5C2022]